MRARTCPANRPGTDRTERDDETPNASACFVLCAALPAESIAPRIAFQRTFLHRPAQVHPDGSSAQRSAVFALGFLAANVNAQQAYPSSPYGAYGAPGSGQPLSTAVCAAGAAVRVSSAATSAAAAIRLRPAAVCSSAALRRAAVRGPATLRRACLALFAAGPGPASCARSVAQRPGPRTASRAHRALSRQPAGADSRRVHLSGAGGRRRPVAAADAHVRLRLARPDRRRRQRADRLGSQHQGAHGVS